MKILNFGSINIDYVYRVDAFVRPGETKMSQGRSIFAGGKGFNQSIALARAGAEVYHAGQMAAGDTFLTDMLEEAGVNTRFIRRGEQFTGHAIIQIDDSGQNCILLCNGANFSITEEFVDEVLDSFGKDDILLLQNEINGVAGIIHKAYARGMYIVLNPSPINEDLLRFPLDKISCFILNEIEGRELTGCDEIGRIPDKMLARFPCASIVLTLGRQGVVYRDKERQESFGIFDMPVVDTTGAGDTFTGYFVMSLKQGYAIKQALARASAASSISVSRNGAGPSIPCMQEVDSLLKEMNANGYSI